MKFIVIDAERNGMKLDVNNLKIIMTLQQKAMMDICEIAILKMQLTDNLKKDIHRLGAILSLN